MKRTLFFLILSIVLPIQAATIYVKPASSGGNDETGDGSTWATAYATPTQAFSVATTDGDVIAVMKGTYLIPFSFANTAKITNLKVQGGYTGVSDERVVDPSNTIFEFAGTTTVRVLSENYGAGLLFSGIQFQNLQPAASQYGTFVNIPANGHLSMEDCVVKNFVNLAGQYVRGIIRFNGSATLNIDRCQFVDCEEKSTATHNAFITRNGGTATLNIKNSIVRGIKTKPFVSSSAGGSNKYTITNCNFIDNPGGAGVNMSTNVTTVISNSIIYKSALSGGGTLNNSYYNGTIGTFTANNSVLFTDVAAVFADVLNYYPAPTFAGIDTGDNSVVTEGDKDVAGNERKSNNTVDVGAYENIVAPMAVAGNNVVSVGTAASSFYAYCATAQLPLTVAAGSVPDPIEGVIFTGTSPDFTASFAVKAPQTITFNATQASNEVTVIATNITVTSPTLVDGKYSTATSSIIYFTLNEGTGNLVATVNGESVAPVHISGNDYSLTLTGISGATTVVLSATVNEYAVTLTKNSYVASVSGLAEGSQQKQHGYNEFSFTLTEGAHSPYVSINGEYFASTENEGVYSIPGFRITSASAITVSAFAANVLPVSDDTYQRQGGVISGSYANEKVLVSRGAPAGWAVIPLLKFVPTVAMKTAGYTKVSLTFVPAVTAAGLSYTVREFPAEFESIRVVGVNDYTKLMEAAVVGTADHAVSFTANEPVELDVTSAYILDFPNELVLSLVKASNGNLHNIHSFENGNADFVPALVFSSDISTGDKSMQAGLSVYYRNGSIVVNNMQSTDKLQIFDMQGRKVVEKTISGQIAEFNHELTHGVYIFKAGDKKVKVLINN